MSQSTLLPRPALDIVTTLPEFLALLDHAVSVSFYRMTDLHRGRVSHTDRLSIIVDDIPADRRVCVDVCFYPGATSISSQLLSDYCTEKNEWRTFGESGRVRLEHRRGRKPVYSAFEAIFENRPYTATGRAGSWMATRRPDGVLVVY